MIHIGVTGTRGILSPHQKRWLKDELVTLDLSVRLVQLQHPVLHHGDCLGADAFAHELAVQLGWSVVIHPPLNSKYRAYCSIEDAHARASKILRERKYLARDRLLAARCSIILGLPGLPRGEHVTRAGNVKIMSGTWYTLEQAMDLGKEVKICGQS